MFSYRHESIILHGRQRTTIEIRTLAQLGSLGSGQRFANWEQNTIGITSPFTPELYDSWIEALVHAVSECDGHFDRELESHWRTVLRTGIDLMTSAY